MHGRQRAIEAEKSEGLYVEIDIISQNREREGRVEFVCTGHVELLLKLGRSMMNTFH